MSRKNRSRSERKSPLWVVMGLTFSLAAVVVLVGFLNKPDEEKNQTGITEQILSYSGFTRVIEQAEAAFYYQLARREVDDIDNRDQMDQRTKEIAQRINAQFFLGNKLGLIGPYSFSYLQDQMQIENAQRKLDKKKGKAFYGPEQFDIYSYYQYVASNLEVRIIEYLAANADESMRQQARAYFEENKALYNHAEQIVYSITDHGNTEEHTIDWGQLSSLNNADSELAEILRVGKVGQTFSYTFGDSQRTGKIISRTDVQTDFEQQQIAITSDFLKSGYYKQLLQDISDHNAVVFSEK